MHPQNPIEFRHARVGAGRLRPQPGTTLVEPVRPRSRRRETASLFALTAIAALLGAFSASAAPKLRELPLETFRDKLRGGWAGQMIGVSYGSIYEFQSNGKPIDGPLRPWKPEFIDNSLQQDDIYVEMTFLKTLVDHGPNATAVQAGEDFRDSKYRLWHANMAARENLRQGLHPPQTGHPRYNPHADDIDFQIEADLFGLIAPGMPQTAGKFSDTFGSVMNYGDGVYGGRFVTAMYSQAYLETECNTASVRRCFEAGLASIPAKSTYAQILRDVMAGYRDNPTDWRKTWNALEKRWGTVDTCPEGRGNPFNIDAKLNGAYIALGLLYGEGDFEKTMEITTRCGQDADCNPSNGAGVLGALLGYERIPKQFTSGIPGLTGKRFEYTEYDFPTLVAACEKVTRQVLEANGGKFAEKDGRTVLLFPVQKPKPPTKLEQMRDFPDAQLLAWSRDFDQRRVKAIPIAQWAPGWKLIACGTDMEPGLRAEVNGKPHVLVLHPVSRTEPAVIEAKLGIPKTEPSLLLHVSSFSGSPNADWLLRVTVEGVEAAKQVIHSPDKWQAVRVDLSRWAGKTVTVRIENAAGGKSDWAWEAGYLLPPRWVSLDGY